MEIGQMLNPTSGETEMYKEYWTGPPPDDDASVKAEKVPCVVARTIDGVGGTREGLIVRVGRHAQGLFQTRPGSLDGFWVERWFKHVTSDPFGTRGRRADIVWMKDWRSNTSPEAKRS